jgi:hypothetical protein
MAGGIVQVVEPFPSMHNSLDSQSSSLQGTKKKYKD